MIKKLLAACLVFASCGPDVSSWRTCVVSDFRDVRVASDNDCNKLSADIDVARKVAVGSGLMYEEDWREIAKDTPLYVYSDDNWTEFGSRVSGYTVCNHHIETGHEFASLLHEVLHQFQCNKGLAVESPPHLFWHERGYYGLSDVYMSETNKSISNFWHDGCDMDRPTPKQIKSLEEAGFDVNKFESDMVAREEKCETIHWIK